MMVTVCVKVGIVTKNKTKIKNKIDYFLRIKNKNNSYNNINTVITDVF